MFQKEKFLSPSLPSAASTIELKREHGDNILVSSSLPATRQDQGCFNIYETCRLDSEVLGSSSNLKP